MIFGDDGFVIRRRGVAVRERTSEMAKTKVGTALTPDEALALIKSRDPYVTPDCYDEGTPCPICFWCGASNWRMEHMPDCVYLRVKAGDR